MAPEYAAWLFVRPESVPKKWESRAEPAMFIPLLAEEAAAILEGGITGPTLGDSDELLARLVAQGQTLDAVARQLGVSRRTAQRRLADLRARLGVSNSFDLATVLSARGFRVARTAPIGDAGPGSPLANRSLEARRASQRTLRRTP